MRATRISDLLGVDITDGLMDVATVTILLSTGTCTILYYGV